MGVFVDYCGMWTREQWKFARAMEASFVPLVALDATTFIICLTAAPARSAIGGVMRSLLTAVVVTYLFSWCVDAIG